MQSRRQSLAEVLTNTFVGMLGSWTITVATFSLIREPVLAASATTVACTAWSLVRNYAIRRRFARMEQRDDQKAREGP